MGADADRRGLGRSQQFFAELKDGFLAFARHQFELSAPQEDGSTLLDHLQASWRRTKQMPQKLAEAPELPGSCAPLWEDFLSLHESRGTAGLGAARITFVDMDAWQRVTGKTLSPWDVEVIRKTDDMWLAEFAPKPKTP